MQSPANDIPISGDHPYIAACHHTDTDTCTGLQWDPERNGAKTCMSIKAGSYQAVVLIYHTDCAKILLRVVPFQCPHCNSV